MISGWFLGSAGQPNRHSLRQAAYPVVRVFHVSFEHSGRHGNHGRAIPIETVARHPRMYEPRFHGETASDRSKETIQQAPLSTLERQESILIPSQEPPFLSKLLASCETVSCESTSCVVKISFDGGSRGFLRASQSSSSSSSGAGSVGRTTIRLPSTATTSTGRPATTWSPSVTTGTRSPSKSTVPAGRSAVTVVP